MMKPDRVDWLPRGGGGMTSAVPEEIEPEISDVVGPFDRIAEPVLHRMDSGPIPAENPLSPGVLGWSLEPLSTRGAALVLTAVPPDRRALHIELGCGDGDTIVLGRPVSLARDCHQVSVSYYALTLDHAPLSMGLALHAPGSKPWWVAQPSPVVFRRDATHNFELTAIDPDGLRAIDRLLLILVTTSRDGFMVLQDVRLREELRHP